MPAQVYSILQARHWAGRQVGFAALFFRFAGAAAAG